MRVRMMTTRVAAPNGRDQQTFQAGAVYDLSLIHISEPTRPY